MSKRKASYKSKLFRRNKYQRVAGRPNKVWRKKTQRYPQSGRTLLGFPRSMMVDLKAGYAEAYTTNDTFVGFMQVNAAFEPFNVANRQGTPFDKLATLYHKCYVVSGYCKVTFQDQSAGAKFCSAYITQNLAALTAAGDIMQMPGAVYKNMPESNDSATLYVPFSVYQTMGQRSSQHDNLQSDVDANPASLMYLHYRCENEDNANLNLKYKLEIVQRTVFFQKLDAVDA